MPFPVRTPLMLSGAVLALGAIGGCGDQGTPTTSPPTTASTSPAATSPGATPTPAPPAPSASSPEPDASPTPANVANAHLATCATSQLNIGYEVDPGGGAAGSTYGHVTFRNTASTPCALFGWPGVSFVGGGNGTQLGAAAQREGTPRVVRLDPGQSRSAKLRTVDPGVYGGSCMRRAADGFRVYPPNQRAAAFVAHSGTACASAAVSQLTIWPVS